MAFCKFITSYVYDRAYKEARKKKMNASPERHEATPGSSIPYEPQAKFNNHGTKRQLEFPDERGNETPQKKSRS